jgi:membrane protease subunit (stomatin/prohibitin family)
MTSKGGQEMGIFSGLFGSSNDDQTPEALRDISWGVAQPVMVKLSTGIGKFRAFGSYTLQITDRDQFRTNCCDPEDEEGISELRTDLNMKLTRAFADSLGQVAGSKTAGELAASIRVVEEGIIDVLREELRDSGLTMTRLSVDKLVQA